LVAGGYVLATIHRAESTDDPAQLRDMFGALEDVASSGLPLVIPLHPRTANALRMLDIQPERVRAMPPVGYLEMLHLEANARAIVTDSGGVQKEAYWVEVPCVTMRNETEWTETVASGWNTLVGRDREKIRHAVLNAQRPVEKAPGIYGDGHAAERIVELLASDARLASRR
jgi:UDP-GlcNAc3NAcA epimerase